MRSFTFKDHILQVLENKVVKDVFPPHVINRLTQMWGVFTPQL
jgi:hypothetical protein